MNRKSLVIALAVLMALPVLSLTAQAGHHSDAWLGIYTQTVDDVLKEAFDLDSDYGVVVKMVIDDSPAEEAGLKQGDIILMFDGEKLTDADQLVASVKNHDPEDEVKILIARKGKELELVAELGSRSKYEDAERYYKKALKLAPQVYSKTYKLDKFSLSDTYIGVTLENLNYQLGEYFGVKDGKGALVTEVMDDSPAAKAGLKAGDVIIKVDGEEVDKLSDVKEAVSDKDEGDKIELSVLRNKNQIEFALEVEESPEDFRHLENVFMIPDFDDDIITLPNLPKMKGLFRGDFDFDVPDMSELQEELEELEEELEELREELKELQEKLD